LDMDLAAENAFDGEIFANIMIEVYKNTDNKNEVVEIVKKFINLSSPTFRSEGNELFSEDAEKISTCIFGDSRDKIEQAIFKVIEDDIIYKDLYSLDNGKLLEDISGHRKYITEHGRILDVINVNRKEGEKALGVDLIYYMHEYHSIVMLQYKRIESGVYYTSNDANYEKEIKRMLETRDYFKVPAVSDNNLRHKFFRLSECPYYLKLCPASSTTTHRFVSGACIHLDYWMALIASDTCRTRNGNAKLGYSDLDARHLTSMEFINLVKRGLLGGFVSGLSVLQWIIVQLKNQNHIVVAAVESSS